MSTNLSINHNQKHLLTLQFYAFHLQGLQQGFIILMKVLDLFNKFPLLFQFSIILLFSIIHFEYNMQIQIMPARHLLPNNIQIKGILSIRQDPLSKMNMYLLEILNLGSWTRIRINSKTTYQLVTIDNRLSQEIQNYLLQMQ